MFLGSGVLMRKMVSLQFPSKVGLYRSLGMMMEVLVGRLQKDILGS